MSNSVGPHRLQPTRLFCPWNSTGRSAGVSNHSLLQGIFPTHVNNVPKVPCLVQGSLRCHPTAMDPIPDRSPLPVTPLPIACVSSRAQWMRSRLWTRPHAACESKPSPSLRLPLLAHCASVILVSSEAPLPPSSSWLLPAFRSPQCPPPRGAFPACPV